MGSGWPTGSLARSPLPPSHCEGQGRRPAAAVTRPSRPITGLYQSEAGRRGRAGGHCGAGPVPVLAPPQARLTCWGCRRRRRHSRRGLNRSPRPHFRGPRGPPPPAGCDTPPTSGSRNGAHAARPATTLGAPRASESRLRPPHPTRHTRGRPGPHPREGARRPARAADARPRPRAGHRPGGGAQAAWGRRACAGVPPRLLRARGRCQTGLGLGADPQRGPKGAREEMSGISDGPSSNCSTPAPTKCSFP